MGEEGGDALTGGQRQSSALFTHCEGDTDPPCTDGKPQAQEVILQRCCWHPDLCSLWLLTVELTTPALCAATEQVPQSDFCL